MVPEPDLSTIAALIGDPTRATMLSALLSGQSLPASDLAYRAHITPQTASTHLARLVEGGLLDVSRTGRHRYYRLKNAHVAHALEALANLAAPPHLKTPKDSAAYDALCFARTCYDHLAGQMGVALTQALTEKGLIVEEGQIYTLTPAGMQWLAVWNIDERTLRQSRRMFARTCVDWSERRHHLAGALGSALTQALFERGWIVRIAGQRAVRVTDIGRRGFRDEFGIDVSLASMAYATHVRG